MAMATRFVRIRLAQLLAALACVLVSDRAAASTRPPTVLILDAYGGTWESARQLTAGLRRDVHGKNGAPLEFVEVSLRPGTEGVASVEAPLVAYVNALFREEPPALVVALGRAAGRFVYDHRAQLFPSTPTLTLFAIRPDFAELTPGPNDAYVTFEFDLAWAIDTLLGAFPATHRLFVVFGHTAAEQRLREAFKPFFAARYPNLAVMWANDLTFKGLTDTVAQLPSDSLVIYGGFDVDAANERIEDAIALPRVLAAASVPTAAVYADKLGTGVAATAHADLESYVREASSAARELLAGTAAADVRRNPPATMGASFDARALARFGVSRAGLSEQATIINESASAWTSGGVATRTVGVLFVIQFAAAAGLFVGLRRARARSEALRTSYADGARLREGIVGRVVEGARESLTRRLSRLSTLAAEATRQARVDAEAAEDLRSAVREVTAQFEEACMRVAPAALDDLGLEAALRTECGARRASSSLDVLFSGRAPSFGLAPERALALYRSLQHLLEAAADDPTPRTVRVSLEVAADRVALSLDDPHLAEGSGLARSPRFLAAVETVRAALHAAEGGVAWDAAGEGLVVAWVPAHE